MNISSEWEINSILNPEDAEIHDYIAGGHKEDGYFAINSENASITGFWRIRASSMNYVLRSIPDTSHPSDIYFAYDRFQAVVNVTQSTGLPENLPTSVANLSIFHPNGTVFWKTSCVPNSSGVCTFPVVVFGASNTSAGRYDLYYSWTNGTAVGFNATTVVVQHASQIDLILPSNYDPNTPLPALFGSSLALRVEILDMDAKQLIGNINVTLLINGNTYRFNEVLDGIYDLNLDSQILPQAGKYNCLIYVEGIGVSPEDFSLNIDFFIPQTMMYVLIGVITALVVVIAAVLAWTKVILPRRKRAYDELMEITSHYYDAHALVGYLVLHKSGGHCIFDQWQDLADKKVDSTVISGFLTAITAFGEQLPIAQGFDDLRDKKLLASGDSGKYRVMSLDYQDFVILLLDGRFIRVAAIFASKPSAYFEPRLQRFVEEFEEMYNRFLANFAGSVEAFQKADVLFNKYLHFHMTRPIGLAESTHVKILQKNVELTDGERRMINVIQTFLREKDYVRLRTVVSFYATATKEEELIAIKGIMGLWLKGMLAPVDPEESLETALRFFSQEDAEILKVVASGTLNHDIIATEVKLPRNAVDAKLQSFRAWKLINLRDQITEKGRILLERRLASKA